MLHEAVNHVRAKVTHLALVRALADVKRVESLGLLGRRRHAVLRMRVQVQQIRRQIEQAVGAVASRADETVT